MTYKSTQVYVVMREMWDPSQPDSQHEHHAVAVFKDMQTADGNMEGYNLSMKEEGIDSIHFYLTMTMMYE
jgi:hypothetical protein